jgi:hypothetical protein
MRAVAALVGLILGIVQPSFAEGLANWTKSAPQRAQSQRADARAADDLLASARPSPAELRRCVVGHHLNAVSRSACKAR